MDTKKPNFLSLVAKATGQRWVWGSPACLSMSCAASWGKWEGGVGGSWGAHLSNAFAEKAEEIVQYPLSLGAGDPLSETLFYTPRGVRSRQGRLELARGGVRKGSRGTP